MIKSAKYLKGKALEAPLPFYRAFNIADYFTAMFICCHHNKNSIKPVKSLNIQ